jgi:Na+/H+ antiporter NhaD/arsenite permease-like protein
VPFAFSQFILIEALAHQGWIDVFAIWLIHATGRQIYPTIWIVGVFGVVLCNLSGTNIGATILLTKVVRAAAFPDHSLRAAAIALAVASNVGAVSFTFSASLAGLLWRGILDQKGIHIKQTTFAFWNLLPITVMTAVGLGVVCIEMAVISR